jgi:hypothetical protein
MSTVVRTLLTAHLDRRTASTERYAPSGALRLLSYYQLELVGHSTELGK